MLFYFIYLCARMLGDTYLTGGGILCLFCAVLAKMWHIKFLVFGGW